MDPHQSLRSFAEQYGGLDQKRFLAGFPAPFLMVDPGPRLMTEEQIRPYTVTSTAARMAEMEADSGVLDPLKILAVPLVKSDRNAFPNMISLGRSANNDVVVSHPRVSKFHAFFKKNPATGALSVWDAGSTYGTAVNGLALPEGKAGPLETRCVIELGGAVRITYFSAVDFFHFIRL